VDATRFGYQLDMPIIQRGKHLAENIEELVIAGLPRDLRSVGLILRDPVDFAQREKWISAIKGVPKLFEIRFGVANDHEVTWLG
jgi:hypothetical protein